MQEFIGTFIARLRRFFWRSNHDAIEQASDCSEYPIGGEVDLDVDPARFNTAVGHREQFTAERPLELAIIDTTLLDCYVLDTRVLLPLGRPCLTACLDVYSRMPLGYCITFEPPPLYSVLATLKSVSRHKRYVQQLYPRIGRPWDGWGCPTEILLDLDSPRQSPAFQHSTSNLGTQVHYAPANMPQYNAISERWFDTVAKGLAHKLAGAVRRTKPRKAAEAKAKVPTRTSRAKRK